MTDTPTNDDSLDKDDEDKDQKGKGKKGKRPRAPKQKGMGAIIIKLGRPYNMPASHLDKRLHQTAHLCSVARNAAATNWLLWRRAHPDWQPNDPYNAPPTKIKTSPRRPKDPTKPPINPEDRKDSPIAPRLYLSRELNHAVRDAAPSLSSNIASCCVQHVIKALKRKTSYVKKERGFKGRWFWESILLNEDSLPNYRNSEFINAPKSSTKLIYSDDGCYVQFSLFSKECRERVLAPIVRLHVKDLSNGHRRILKQLTNGTMPLCDSQITFFRGDWYINLSYKLPTSAIALPKDRVLTVEPCGPNDPRPFRLYWTNEDGDARTWDVGAGRPLTMEYRRIQAIRRAVRSKGYMGHGQQKQHSRTSHMSDRVILLCDRFRKQTVADIIRLAISERCGSILYHEPTMPVRENTWFADQDVPMDWTKFESHLANKSINTGLEYHTERIGMAEWQPKYRPRKGKAG